jgi:hypothetical protein
MPTSSRFTSKLPGELRNKIYRYALVSQDIDPLTAEGKGRTSLLRVNRQIRAEAITFYYGENSFATEVTDETEQELAAWAAVIDKTHGELILSLSLELKPSEQTMQNHYWEILYEDYERSRR